MVELLIMMHIQPSAVFGNICCFNTPVNCFAVSVKCFPLDSVHLNIWVSQCLKRNMEFHLRCSVFSRVNRHTMHVTIICIYDFDAMSIQSRWLHLWS